MRCGQFFSIAECYNFIETNQTPIKVVDSEANKNSNSNVEAEADYGSWKQCDQMLGLKKLPKRFQKLPKNSLSIFC